MTITIHHHHHHHHRCKNKYENQSGIEINSKKESTEKTTELDSVHQNKNTLLPSPNSII